MPKLKSEPVRIVTGNTRGWQVRFYYQEDGKTKYHSKLFSDGVHGGEQAAYEAAIAYRDAHQHDFGSCRDRDIEPYRRADRRNNSGVPGIVFYEHAGKRGPLVHVRAHVPAAEGAGQTKTLSLKKHGRVEAVQAACRFRYEGLAELHGDASPYASWQRLYNEIVATVGKRYGLTPVEEPRASGDTLPANGVAEFDVTTSSDADA